MSKRDCEHRLKVTTLKVWLQRQDKQHVTIAYPSYENPNFCNSRFSIMQRTSSLPLARKTASEIIDSKFYHRIWRRFDATFVMRIIGDP